MATKCNIMTDSCCDFSAEEVERAGITCLSFTYTEAGKPDGGLSGVDDLFQSRSAHEFYSAIENGACPMTSQPSQMVYEEAFEKAIASGVPTVHFALSSGISGAYNGAVTALDRVREKHGGTLPTPIYVVDCLIGSTTQNLLIHAAIEKRDEGLTAEELVAWAEEARFHAHTIFMVDNLDALHRGGRIPKSVAVVGGLLDVKPLLTFNLDGSLAIMGMARGRRKAMRKMAEFYEDFHDTWWRSVTRTAWPTATLSRACSSPPSTRSRSTAPPSARPSAATLVPACTPAASGGRTAVTTSTTTPRTRARLPSRRRTSR